MEATISKFKKEVEDLQSQMEEAKKSEHSLEQEKVSLQMKMAELEEQKEGIKKHKKISHSLYNWIFQKGPLISYTGT